MNVASRAGSITHPTSTVRVLSAFSQDFISVPRAEPMASVEKEKPPRRNRGAFLFCYLELGAETYHRGAPDQVGHQVVGTGDRGLALAVIEIGRASCRERV